MKLGVSHGVCRGSETSPMMGSTPYGVAARRTCPSSVASLRGRATHAPANSRVRTVRYDGLYYICLGQRPGSPKVGSRMVLAGGWGGGWSSRSSPRTVSPAFCGADHRRGRGGSRGRGRPCDLQRQVPAVPLLWRGGAPASVHRQSG